MCSVISSAIQLKDKGFTMEQCLGLEEVPDKRIGNTKNRGKPVEVEGKKFDSQREACRYYNVKEATFIKRKQKSLTIEQCLGLEDVPDNRYSSGRRV